MPPRSAGAAGSLLPPTAVPRMHERLSHSVNFWPGSGEHRWLLHVASDVDHCRFRLGGMRIEPESLCIHAARNGVRMRNFIVRNAWLVFEPEEGPGEYELYTHCDPPEDGGDAARPEVAWRAEAVRGLAADPYAFASALLTTREARAAAVGPPWRDTLEYEHHWGAHRRSVGNLRARLHVSAADAAVGAVRALVPWRRRHSPSGTALLGYFGESQLSVAHVRLIEDGREAAEILLDTSQHGGGEYNIYYLPHTQRWEAYDARDDAHGARYDAYRDDCLSSYASKWCDTFSTRADLPRAHVFDIQARTHRDRADSMGRPATKAETAALLRAAAGAADRSGARADAVAAATRDLRDKAGVSALSEGTRSLHTHLRLTVGGTPLTDKGDARRWRLSRLRWLDSTAGAEPAVPSPFAPEPITAEEDDVEAGALGRHMVLASPLRFDVRVYGPGGKEEGIEWKPLTPAKLESRSDASAVWSAKLRATHADGAGGLRLGVRGVWWFDASAELNLTLENTGTSAIDVTQAELGIDVAAPDVAKYVMGLGAAGDLLTAHAPLTWQWRAGLGNYMVWLGNVHAGVRLRLVGTAANFESSQHILTESELPDAWHNGGKGGVHVGGSGRVRAYGGARRLAPGEAVSFAFELLLTPCKPLDPAAHWRQRYYQVGYPTAALVEPAQVAATGASVLNIHQGVDGLLNPHINYPFDRRTTAHMAEYVEAGHAHRLKVKAYYTIRELSNHADELWVLRALGDEVLTDGRGGGDAWAQEHLVDGFGACWQTPLADGTFDSALCTHGISRWLNYYIEGLTRLFRPPVALDGIYYDGIGFGVHTMRRVRRTLESVKGRGEGLVDLHCGNNLIGTQYGMVQPQLQFMHLMPYIDSVWFGEGYDYNAGNPHWWLVETSGIPFGLMGDMMHAGHVWRGMVYGMTTRFRCADPTPLWQLWDSFGMANASMLGYWDARAPATTPSCEHVKVTSYVRRGHSALVALASWESQQRTCEVQLDYAALGFPNFPPRVTVTLPDLAPLGQDGPTAVPLRREDRYNPVLSIEAGAGALLLVRRAPNDEP